MTHGRFKIARVLDTQVSQDARVARMVATSRTGPSATATATGGRTASCTAAASPAKTTPNAG
jgi:hypothetical protein